MKSKVINNASWIIGCKIGQSLVSLIIGMMSARYLGPSNYGLINYAASIVAFLVPVMQLGLRATLVQEFILAPEKEGKILGTSVLMNVVSGMCCIIGIISFVSVINKGETDTIIICALYSISLLFQATEMVQYWFQAKLMSKYPSIAMLVAYIIVSIYKVYLLATGKSIYWFAISYAIDHFVISLILIVAYKRICAQRLSVSLNLAKKMLSKSKYYILSSMMVTIFQQTDRIMLKLMLGESETGYYSASIVCIGITSFVFSAIIDSARPEILESQKKSVELFEKNVSRLFSLITFISLGQSICMSMLASPIVTILYGSEYLPSVDVLRVAVWYVTFSNFGSVRNIWILAEGKQKYLLAINIVGALTNVILNVLLIPVLSTVGAALASLLTQIVTNVVLVFVVKSLRRSNVLMLKGLNPKLLIEVVNGLIRRHE